MPKGYNLSKFREKNNAKKIFAMQRPHTYKADNTHVVKFKCVSYVSLQVVKRMKYLRQTSHLKAVCHIVRKLTKYLPQHKISHW